ncbi:hypothetical protein [Paenibacillus endoradicis]|uniref:hypothetical protein n=1 Tax=Paenibacillus endoradicis TaxID=2972487 RepID=UPI00215990C6|nr:hypothetical protein [Paenibacillus endoradicis]MCR8656672.1 hypothetical protein [Paenibacillus endoradicis]
MRLLLATILILLSIGCSNETITEEIILIEPDQIQEISFINKPGRVTIVFNESRGVDIIVWTKDLDPLEDYEIALVYNDKNGGVIFGPEANLEIKIGNIEGETILHPNHNGELYVSMLNPERIFTGAEQMKIEISTINKQKVIESYPFRF